MEDVTRRRLVRAGSVAVAVATAGCSGTDGTVESAEAPNRAVVGEAVTVRATVSNGGLTGTARTVALTVDGEEVATKAVEVGGRDETTVEFSHRFSTPGTYELVVGGIEVGTVEVRPALAVSSATLTAEGIVRGGATAVDATVENRGDAEVEGSIPATVDGETVRRQAVTVAAGSETAVSIPVAPTAPGDHEVGVDGVDAGTLTVRDAWHQFGHGAGNTASTTDGGPSDDPSRAWDNRLRHGAAAEPVVHDGTVYAAVGNPYGASDRGALLAVDPASGDARWAERTVGAVLGSPAVTAGRIVVGTTDGALRDVQEATELRGHLTGFAPDGSEDWSFETESPVIEAPTAVDGTVYATTVGGTVLAVDAVDGTVRWRRGLDGVSFPTRAVGDGSVLILGRAGVLRALSVDDGSQRWKRDIDGYGFSGPSVADGVAYATGVNRSRSGTESTIHAVSVADGSIEWSATVDDLIATSLTLGDDGIYAGVGISVWAFERENGDVRWRSDGARVGSSGGAPTVADGTVYAGVGRVNGGYLYAFDPASGDRMWEREDDSAEAGIAVTDDALYTVVGFGTLVAYR